jgi:NAD-dependent deacetylase
MYINSDVEEKIVIFTGAGISQESGISTFRDVNGTWENHKIDDVCNERTYKKNIDLVNRFYNERRADMLGKEPNEAHKTIARIQKRYGDKVLVVTQNVDNLLEKGGCTNVLHVHGTLTQMTCEKCHNNYDIEGDFTIDTECPNCLEKGDARPNIVFFGGQAPMYKYMHRAFSKLEHENSSIVVSGTSGAVVSMEYICTRLCVYSCLNNMESSKYINDYKFDDVMYQSASTAWLEIEQKLHKLYD